MCMSVKCPVCSANCKEYGNGRYTIKGNGCYKYIMSKCEEHGEFTISVPDVAPVVMPAKKGRRTGYYD